MERILLLLFKGKEELQAAILVLSGRDLSAMELYGILYDGQAQACSAGLSRPPVIDPVKSFKDACKVFLIDLIAGIGKGEIIIFLVLQVVGEIDPGAFPAVFNYVIE